MSFSFRSLVQSLLNPHLFREEGKYLTGKYIFARTWLLGYLYWHEGCHWTGLKVEGRRQFRFDARKLGTSSSYKAGSWQFTHLAISWPTCLSNSPAWSQFAKVFPKAEIHLGKQFKDYLHKTSQPACICDAVFLKYFIKHLQKAFTKIFSKF